MSNQSQKLIITEIQNPKFYSNAANPHITVQKHRKDEIPPDFIEFRSRYLRVGQKSVKPQYGGTIRDYLVEKQYDNTDLEKDENYDPFANRSKARPKPKFSFHPEFNAHFSVVNRVKVKKRSEEDNLDEVQWFGQQNGGAVNPHLDKDVQEIFFPFAPRERTKAVISTNAMVRKQTASGAPVTQRVNIIYEDPQMAALEHHEARKREQEEKERRVQEFRERVKERVQQRQQREQRQKQEELEKKSPTRKEKMKSYAEKIQRHNTRKYNKEQQKRFEDEERAREYQELIEKQAELTRKQQLAQREQELYARRQPDPHAHQLSGRGAGSGSASSRSHVSKRSVLHSARSRGKFSARDGESGALSARDGGALSARGDALSEYDDLGALSARSIPPEPRSARMLKTPEIQGRESIDAFAASAVPPLALNEVSSHTQKPQFTPPRMAAAEQDHQHRTQNDQAVVEEDRYIEALRLQLIAKVKQQNIVLPPLCNCGLDPFDDHPSKCCSNCEFYRNPAAYVRLLESLLHSYGISV